MYSLLRVYKKLPHKGTALKRKINKGAILNELHLVFYKFKKSFLEGAAQYWASTSIRVTIVLINLGSGL